MKEAIVNSPAQFPFTPAAATTSANLNIKGFGTFMPAKITAASGRRYSAEQLEKIAITCPATSALGLATTDVGIPVTMNIRMFSSRHASETAIDFIKKGRPLVIEFKLNGNTSAANVAIVVKAAIDELKFKYPNLTIPFTAAISTADIVLTASAGEYSFGYNVTFIKRGDVLPYTAVTTKNFVTTATINDGSDPAGEATIVVSDSTIFSVGDTIQFLASPTVDHKITEIVLASHTLTVTPVITATGDAVNGQAVWKTQKAVEAVGSGKILEEELRMSTGLTSDAYAIQAGQVPIIGGKYTQITWSMDVPTLATDWNSHLNQGAVGAAVNNQTFTMFFNEDNCLASGGLVELLVTWLVAQAPSIGTFKKANGASAPDAAGFIA